MSETAEWLKNQELADRISSLRLLGKIDEAIELSLDAGREFPRSYFFPKISGDLSFLNNDYDNAAKSYLQFLRAIPRDHKHSDIIAADFAKRYYRLTRVLPREKISDFANSILQEIRAGTLNEKMVLQCLDIITPDLPKSIEISQDGKNLIPILSDDSHFSQAVSICKKLESENPIEIELILDTHVLNRERSSKTRRIDSYAVSVYERMQKNDDALKIAVELMARPIDGVLVRSILRICRKLQNYQKFDIVINEYPEILKNDDFNVLYELVYYFEAKNNFTQVQNSLTRIEKQFADSSPIQKTLKNFYGRFGMLDDASRVTERISEIEARRRRGSGRFDQEVQESEAKIWSTIKELSSQLEYQTQLAAISELTTGISHELGQPITNIRYTIQFYERQFEKNIDKQTVLNVFKSILQETERMGGLVKRLSPITSSRNVIETFDMVDRIQKRVNAENTRLQKNQISVSILPHTPLYFTSDPVRFDQLISNLLLNSIDAIKEKNDSGPKKIRVRIDDKRSEISIIFEDTGKGITAKDRGKIFSPFFSTKAPGKGEGLGLFIVWNILKMQGGKIYLDPIYNDGARFVITIPKRGSENEKHNFAS